MPSHNHVRDGAAFKNALVVADWLVGWACLVLLIGFWLGGVTGLAYADRQGGAGSLIGSSIVFVAGGLVGTLASSLFATMLAAVAYAIRLVSRIEMNTRSEPRLPLGADDSTIVHPG